MLIGKKVFSAMVGAAMLSMPAVGLAGHYDEGASVHHYSNHERANVHGYRTGRMAPFQMADDDDWHHHDHDRDDWNRHHHGRPFDYNDYNWGGRNRYDHPYSYYNNPTPPPAWGGWNSSQRQAYLIRRRDGAIRLQRQMRAKGDNAAAERLSTAIHELNRRITRGG